MKFTSPLKLPIDNLPVYTGDNKMFQVYTQVFNALRQLQDVPEVASSVLSTITADNLSEATLASRIYLRAGVTMTAGTWCVTDALAAGFIIPCVSMHWQPFTNDYLGATTPPTPRYPRRPLFLLKDVAAGDTAEVCFAGILWIAQTLVPGTRYTLNGQTLQPGPIDLAGGAEGGETISGLTCYALSDHHIVFKRMQ